MATIKLERTNEYGNSFRNFRIYIDGVKAGEISNGESKNFEIAAGRHDIICKVDWCSSPSIPLEISGEEMKTFTVSGFKYGKWIIPASLLSIFILVLIRKVPEARYLYYLYIPLGGLLVYYLTIGRKKYLRLTEK